MNKQIKQWAEQSDFGFGGPMMGDSLIGLSAITKFAALVAAHEREQINQEHERQYLKGFQAGKAFEREECALVVEALRGNMSMFSSVKDANSYNAVINDCAAAIRGRK